MYTVIYLIYICYVTCDGSFTLNADVWIQLKSCSARGRCHTQTAWHPPSL